MLVTKTTGFGRAEIFDNVCISKSKKQHKIVQAKYCMPQLVTESVQRESRYAPGPKEASGSSLMTATELKPKERCAPDTTFEVALAQSAL